MIIEVNPDASLENRALTVRSRLYRTIDILDHRRHQVARLGSRAKSLIIPIGLGAVGILIVGTTAAIAIQRRIIRKAKSDWRRVLVQRVVPQPPPAAFMTEAGRRAGLALVLMAVNELAKRVLRSV